MIAKRLDESLAARNKLYEANRQHHLEICDMKRQITNLEEERSRLQEENSRLQKQLQTAQARLVAVAQALVDVVGSEEESSNNKSLVERLEEAPQRIFNVMTATSKNYLTHMI